MQKGTTKMKILKHDVMNDVSKLAKKRGFWKRFGVQNASTLLSKILCMIKMLWVAIIADRF